MSYVKHLGKYYILNSSSFLYQNIVTVDQYNPGEFLFKAFNNSGIDQMNRRE